MTTREATREIEKMNYRVIATTSFANGRKSFDAKRDDNKKLARGRPCFTMEEAMTSLYRAVLAREYL